MKCEIWVEDQDDSEEITVWLEGNSRASIGENAKLLKEYEAKDYNDAMQKYYDLMGFGEYKPMKD